MKILQSVIMIGCLVIAVSGCSDNKKEEAARLEQQMLQEQGQADSIAHEESLAVAQDSAISEIEIEAEQPTATRMPPRPVGEGYTVQVASCESEKYADYLVDLYQKRNYDAYVTTISYEGQTYYRVRAGNFETLSEAQNLVAELKDKYSLSTWIDKIEQ